MTRMRGFQVFLTSKRLLARASCWIEAAALACGLAASPAQAQFPERPMRLVVPFTAGGAADVMARGLAQGITAELGQPVIVDNRGGAGGITAADAVAKAPADGYTLFFGTMGTQAINPALYARLPYDPLRDFAPVALTHINPRVLVVNAGVPASNVAELVALARKKPGALTYGSAGSGSSGHLSGALFETMTSVQLLHVPYKGSAPLLTDLLAGRIDMAFDSYTVYAAHIRAGRVRALAVTSKARMSALPDVPTLAESGLAGYDVANWLGVFAPAHTPQPVIARLNAAIVHTMADPQLRAQLTALGIEPESSTPEALGALGRSELPKWAAIVKRSGARVD